LIGSHGTVIEIKSAASDDNSTSIQYSTYKYYCILTPGLGSMGSVSTLGSLAWFGCGGVVAGWCVLSRGDNKLGSGENGLTHVTLCENLTL